MKMFGRNALTSSTLGKKFNNVAEIGKKYEERFKGTIVEKWIKYWKNLMTDYKEVVIDITKDTKEKPIKALGIISTLGFLGFCVKNNPDELSFRDAVLKSTSDVLLVNPSLQRKESVEHLRLVEKCYNTNVLRRLNIGICSFMWIDNYSDVCNTYECMCTYLELPFVHFHNRIIDIGFWNKWWLLAKHMEDYDINY